MEKGSQIILLRILDLVPAAGLEPARALKPHGF